MVGRAEGSSHEPHLDTDAQVKCRQGPGRKWQLGRGEGDCLQEWVAQASETAHGWGRCSKCPSYSLVSLPISSRPAMGPRPCGGSQHLGCPELVLIGWNVCRVGIER